MKSLNELFETQNHLLTKDNQNSKWDELAKTMCVDWGEKVIGLSLYEPGVHMICPAGRIITTKQWKSELMSRVQEESVSAIVFGVPFFTDSSIGEMSLNMINKALEFKEYFASRHSPGSANLDFFTQDETYSTAEAKERMLASAVYNFKIDYKKIDELSAVIILEEFIRSHNPSLI